MVGIIATVAIEVVTFGISYYYLETKQKNIEKMAEETTKQQNKLQEYGVLLAQLGAVLASFKAHFNKAIALAKSNYIVLLLGVVFFIAFFMFLNQKTPLKRRRNYSLALFGLIVILPLIAVKTHPKEFAFVKNAPQTALRELKKSVNNSWKTWFHGKFI